VEFSSLPRIRKKWEQVGKKNPVFATAGGRASASPKKLAEDSLQILENGILFDMSPESISSMTVLEIGCGVGRLLGLMSERSTRVIGVDVCNAIIQEAQKRTNHLPNVELYQNLGSNFPFIPSRSIDFVYSYRVFNHNAGDVVLSYFNEAFRVLRSGGIFRFHVTGTSRMLRDSVNNLFHMKSRLAFVGFVQACLWFDSVIVIFPMVPIGRSYTKKELRSRLTKIGFTDIGFRDCERLDGGIWVTCRKI